MTFYKIIGFIKRIYRFHKIIGFTKQIYEYKSLSSNHVFTFKISRLAIFICLLIILWFFIKFISFVNKIGPLWAHKGPYGPIGPLWAHRALTGPYGPDFVEKIINFDENNKVINKNIKIINLGILKVKTWFDDKDY